MDTNNLCMVCQGKKIEYAGVPCGHPSLCKSCAMKQATGGKCKVCTHMFGQVKHISHLSQEEDSDDEDN